MPKAVRPIAIISFFGRSTSIPQYLMFLSANLATGPGFLILHRQQSLPPLAYPTGTCDACGNAVLAAALVRLPQPDNKAFPTCPYLLTGIAHLTLRIRSHRFIRHGILPCRNRKVDHGPYATMTFHKQPVSDGQWSLLPAYVVSQGHRISSQKMLLQFVMDYDLISLSQTCNVLLHGAENQSRTRTGRGCFSPSIQRSTSSS